MYFQIENTPERIKRARRTENTKKSAQDEECPRLVLAPFSRPPQVIFDNVLIGTTCERCLEIFNPTKQMQQITLCRTLPQDLVVHLPSDCLFVEPETCYCLTMTWAPVQPMALRETIRFTNENRGRFDVLVVLKSVMNVKGKNKTKILKISPGKIKKCVKKSPKCVTKKKVEAIYNTTKTKSTVNIVQAIQHTTYELCNKENMSLQEHSIDPYLTPCPLEFSPGTDLKFDVSEIFANMRKPKKEIVRNPDKTFDTSCNIDLQHPIPQNVLKPYNKQGFNTLASAFDNLTFTPLKTLQSKNDKLNKGPNIIVSVNSGSDFDDSLDLKNSDKENETRSICITSSQPPNKWVTVTHSENENHEFESPAKQNKKIPNTSSPKEINSLNFSINTEISRISDLSFFPQRVSTERKVLPKINNETQELINDTHSNLRLNSDTYTKESPITFTDYTQMSVESRHQPFFVRDPKLCRQSLFKENQQSRDNYYKNSMNVNFNEQHMYNDLRSDRSPPRSPTPPLQSIPEESGQMSHSFDNTDKMTTFTIHRTFDKSVDRSCASALSRHTWSKKTVRSDTELWKVPLPMVKKIVKSKGKIVNTDSNGRTSNTRLEANKSVSQNISLNQVGNVYSQSFTTDPFSSSTYFYDVEAVDKIEQEFKRWLNYILTPPAELESNVEQKIDVGKAWIENRNKEVPVAPTKEQVSNIYHNSHRLVSLRRSARALLLSPEISQVFVKLNLQIEKKLIAIRTDRNLHLDVGLQKTIMEVLLSYNPLWLRVGLEAIYGFVLQLKSNSDIEGLTTFIIQRMFKNPLLKNKHSKSSAPNMLLPAYMEAIKKFTLKKFFMLVFFLDQAKQKRLISHDPCLFRRNAVCKDSREVIIRFTRELIAGIGDITKHLRPLGYVVCHKQSYLDEYKYAVHNIALDIRDGVRLTKVMEIILMKNGLLSQLRTPPISRLQKIHNVQVALNALKEANFSIDGDIKATDIADGHREKTLSLLWQLIHVFRAPLFVKAANVIQTWWRKKYAVVLENKKREEELREKLNNAASTIQVWWRMIQYNRMVELKMHQLTNATVTIQKYFRRWLCRSRYQRMKTSVQIIEDWYFGIKKIREAREILEALHLRRSEKRYQAATKIQACVKRWICRKRYQLIVKKITVLQSVIRCFLERKRFLHLKKCVTFIQEKYKGKLLMREQMRRLTVKIRSIVVIQSYYRMAKQRRLFLTYKKAVTAIEVRYIALMKMRTTRNHYLILRQAVIKMQAMFRGKICRTEYGRSKTLIINLQRRIKARQKMLKERKRFLQVGTAAVTIQRHIRAYLMMKKQRTTYLLQRKSAITIQQYYRAYQMAKVERTNYLLLRNSVIKVQTQYRNILKMRRDRINYVQLRNAAITLQRRYRALLLMRICRNRYEKLQKASTVIQKRYRARLQMREERSKYLEIKTSCLTIQTYTRAYLAMKKDRTDYLSQRKATITIQQHFRAYQKAKVEKIKYLMLRNAVIKVQIRYRSILIMRRDRNEYMRMRNAAIVLQSSIRCFLERKRFLRLKKYVTFVQEKYKGKLLMKEQMCRLSVKIKSSVVIQSYYRMVKQRRLFLTYKKAVTTVEDRYIALIQMRRTRNYYLLLRRTTIKIQAMLRGKKCRTEYIQCRNLIINTQKRVKAHLKMLREKRSFLKVKNAAVTIQKHIRAYLAMKKERTVYLLKRKSAVTIQKYFRSYQISKAVRVKYVMLRNAVIKVQTYYRSVLKMRRVRNEFVQLRNATTVIQRRYRAILLMRIYRNKYEKLQKAATVIQTRYRAQMHMHQERSKYLKEKTSCVVIQRAFRAYIKRKQIATVTIQRHFRAYLAMKQERTAYLLQRKSAITIQQHYRAYQMAKEERKKYLVLRNAVIKVQTHYRSILKMRRDRSEFQQLRNAAVYLQRYYRALLLMRNARKEYEKFLKAANVIQTQYRAQMQMREERSKYLKMKSSSVIIQSAFRAYINGKQRRQAYLRLKEAVVKIQTWYRSCKENREIKLQYHNAYLDFKKKVLTIQSVVRMYLKRKQYLELKSATIVIQRYYRLRKLATIERENYIKIRYFTVLIQAHVRCYIQRRRFLRIRSATIFIQALHRFKRHRELMKRRKETAAICIQKNIRCYLAKNQYNIYKKRVKVIQELWRGKLLTRLIRWEFLQKRQLMIKLQACVRGYLVRKQVQCQKETMKKLKEEQRRNSAASKIQALFRGHRERMAADDKRVEELRRRWREGALESSQDSLKQRNDEAMELLRNMSDIESIIRVFKSLELLTEVYPMLYHNNASSVVGHVYTYMAFMNRSISSIEVMKYAASVLVNLARYRITGPKIYKRDRIPQILKYMLRFSSNENRLFCIFATYLWVFSKYSAIKQDLMDFLHIPENHKTLLSIKTNVDRMKRMTNNAKQRFHTPQASKIISRISNHHVTDSMNHSICATSNNGSISKITLPALEPDYGITRLDVPQYFEDPQQAIDCLLKTYKL